MSTVYTLPHAPSADGAAAGGHLLRCRSSTMHPYIACVALPRMCPRGARAKVQTLLIDGPQAGGPHGLEESNAGELPDRHVGSAHPSGDLPHRIPATPGRIDEYR